MNYSRITWSAGPLGGSVRIPTFEVGAYIQALRDKHGRALTIRIEAA